MSDPYDVLGLPRHAGEEEIRRRYLELVRESPPDRDPERFAAVRAAYDAVRDPVRRLEALLAQFRLWLYDARAEAEAVAGEGGPPSPEGEDGEVRFIRLVE